jgi:hypothetical protein
VEGFSSMRGLSEKALPPFSTSITAITDRMSIWSRRSNPLVPLVTYTMGIFT